MEKHKYSYHCILLFFVSYLLLYVISSKIVNVILRKLQSADFMHYDNGFIFLSEVHNYGISFSISVPNIFIYCASILAIIIIVFIVIFKSNSLTKLDLISFSILCAGVTHNCVERMNYGYVIDYFNFSFFREFPTFNVADVLICSGAILFIISMYSKKTVK